LTRGASAAMLGGDQDEALIIVYGEKQSMQAFHHRITRVDGQVH
jgi:hypothetical protein